MFDNMRTDDKIKRGILDACHRLGVNISVDGYIKAIEIMIQRSLVANVAIVACSACWQEKRPGTCADLYPTAFDPHRR